MRNAELGAAGRGRTNDRGASFDARLGCGWGAVRERGATTAFGDFGRSGAGERFRAGMAFRLCGAAETGAAFCSERREGRGRPPA